MNGRALAGRQEHEGWAIFEASSTGLPEIQRDDEANKLRDDDEALACAGRLLADLVAEGNGGRKVTRDLARAIQNTHERKAAREADETQHLFEVKLGVIIGLSCGPDHPAIKTAIEENTADYLRTFLDSDDDIGRLVNSWRELQP